MIDDSSNNIFQVASSYGALNEITISENSPTANRRTLSTTRAISEVISSYFTPDVLRSTDEFLGVVLASVPTNTIRLTVDRQLLHDYRRKTGHLLLLQSTNPRA